MNLITYAVLRKIAADTQTGAVAQGPTGTESARRVKQPARSYGDDRIIERTLSALAVTEHPRSRLLPMGSNGFIDPSQFTVENLEHVNTRSEHTKDPWNSAVGPLQQNMPTLIEYASRVNDPKLQALFVDPTYFDEYVDTARKVGASYGRTDGQFGAQSAAEALRVLHQKYKNNIRIGELGTGVLYRIGPSGGVKIGGRVHLSPNTVRIMWDAQRRVLAARLAEFRARYPGDSDRMLALRLGFAHKYPNKNFDKNAGYVNMFSRNYDDFGRRNYAAVTQKNLQDMNKLDKNDPEFKSKAAEIAARQSNLMRYYAAERIR